MSGRLIAVVGPSGAGKDTLLQEALAARTDLVLARRVITRPSNAGGEAHEGVDATEFERRQRAGAFAVSWRAHGLMYGIPISVNDLIAAGTCVLFNGSRNALPSIMKAFPALGVIEISAPREVLRKRLLARGREDADQIEERLSTAGMSPLKGAVAVSNDGAVETAVARLLSAIDKLNS